MDANIHHAAPIDGKLGVALDDLRFSLQRALVATSNIERRLPTLTATESLLDRIEALGRIWRDPRTTS